MLIGLDTQAGKLSFRISQLGVSPPVSSTSARFPFCQGIAREDMARLHKGPATSVSLSTLACQDSRVRSTESPYSRWYVLRRFNDKMNYSKYIPATKRYNVLGDYY